MAPKVRATQCRVGVDPALRTSLVHLPASLCNTLLSRNVVAQTLIVELGTDTQTYYCGWTGLSAAHAVLDDPHGQPAERVIVGPSLSSLFSPVLRDGMEIRVRLFRSPPVPLAEQVHVVPLHADDWEILSIHAEDVETNMLAQVRAARTGQVLAVQVGRSASTVVRFVVESTVPATGDDAEGSVAVRLSTDTEVIVAPKQRAEPHETTETEVPVATPQGPLNAASAAGALTHVLWRVLPESYCRDEALEWTALLPSTHMLPDLAHPSYELVALAFPHAKACFTQVACPTRRNESNEQPTSATASASFGAGDASPTAPRPWPARHIWLGKALRAKLNIADYDLVQISAPPPGAARGAKSGGHTWRALETYDVPTLPGMDDVVARCTASVRGVHLQRTLQAIDQGRLDAYEGAAVHPVPYTSTSGVLLCGGPGSGKTRIVQTVGAQLAADPTLLYRTQYVDCATFVEERMPLVRAHFKEWLDEAAWHAPTLLVLDNLDTLIPAEAEHVDGTRATQLGNALAAKIRASVQDYDVFVLATCQSTTNLHASLQNARLWTETVTVKPPAKDARRAILQSLVQVLVEKRAQETDKAPTDALNGSADAAEPTSDTTPGPSEDKSVLTAPEAPASPPAGAVLEIGDLDWVSLVNNTDGYHAADLQMLTQRAVHQATMRCLLESDRRLTLDMSDFAAAQQDFTPLSLRDVKLQASTTNWSDIGGLHATRQTLRETLEWPTKYAAIFANCPLRLRSGLLLYGYPGCGKTLLASAVAKECGLHFISVKGPEILNKYIGASEKSVRDLFDRAQAAKPCVLFFDEFDSIAPKRGHDSTGVTDRVVNQMLTQMDGAEGLDGVYVLAATSRPDLIDSALLRPGRLDKSLLCDMPNRDDRLDILRAISRKVHVHPSVNLAHWAERTAGFSGADLQALLYNAHLETINASLQPTEAAAPTDAAAPAAVAYTAIMPGDVPPAKKHSGAERAAFADRLARMLGSTPSAPAASDNAEAPVAEPEARLVTNAQLEMALKTTRPSVPQHEVDRLRRIYRNFAGDRDAAFPDGVPSDTIGARTSLM
ncbi:Peroxisome biosynthesis protein pex1 [Malassezia brasiliensis]|uniref:Peroxisomal ATPase PEX1 n=1 Tax=Malassezia brasiliensis TaxID=1821822 RepID=A0AAF0DTN6_9BASI|nr:Peroxisome biosynthesis protein pex1 [Malassezia brasiliensis]